MSGHPLSIRYQQAFTRTFYVSGMALVEINFHSDIRSRVIYIDCGIRDSRCTIASVMLRPGCCSLIRYLLETDAPSVVLANVYGALESRLPFSHPPMTAEFMADVNGEGWNAEQVLGIARKDLEAETKVESTSGYLMVYIFRYLMSRFTLIPACTVGINDVPHFLDELSPDYPASHFLVGRRLHRPGYKPEIYRKCRVKTSSLSMRLMPALYSFFPNETPYEQRSSMCSVKRRLVVLQRGVPVKSGTTWHVFTRPIDYGACTGGGRGHRKDRIKDYGVHIHCFTDTLTFGFRLPEYFPNLSPLLPTPSSTAYDSTILSSDDLLPWESGIPTSCSITYQNNFSLH
ncbi:uncharacterized protein EV420DRAFT_1486998 [Desarmillaria tabescens]|uniref:Uncharacterized protein n=1 Tax=Armillaria tabescens TaxID=1929756 RepID=A0AA39J7S0_ARMTA|nr:uncharacterized protein EV420DRAFT_1486998 [Desarmillaria tabescens]KAK0437721.1 hypothetical protein EV420DRAFT_1486998 [Desarmillaria tabescens]